MSFYNQCIAVIVISLLVQTLGQLIVVKHPPDDNGTTRNLTCMSDDDNAALVWNYNFDANEPDDLYSFTDFVPRIATARNNVKCAIRNSTRCLASWEELQEWQKVTFIDKPMGPVFDFRWKEFEEVPLPGGIYQHMGQVKQRSGSVVFSVPELQRVHVIVCNRQNQGLLEGCFWVVITGWKGDYSKIKLCHVVKLDNMQRVTSEECPNVTSKKFDHGNILGTTYKWHTFRITWDNDEGMIKVFEHSKSEPFLQISAKIRHGHWNPESHVWIGSDKPAQIRLHSYDYLTTKSKSVLLCTKNFQTDNTIFRVELLYGLCSKCEMTVNLVDKNGKYIMNSTRISGDNESVSGGLLNWRLIDLKFSVLDVDRYNLRIEIGTILNDTTANGHWAIGNLRVKNTVDGVRKSTITISKNSRSSKWPRVICRKISDNNSAIVEIGDVTSDLEPYIYKLIESCNSVCRRKENWTICDRTGCISRQGFSGINCDNGKPRFEIIPGYKNLTVNACSNMIQNRNYTLKIWESTNGTMAPEPSTFSELPHQHPELNPSTEYHVKFCVDGQGVIETQIRTLRSAPSRNQDTSRARPQLPSTDKPNEMKERPKIPYLALLAIPLVIIICLLLFIWIRRNRRKASVQETEIPMKEMSYSNLEDPVKNDSPIPLVNLGSIHKSSPDVVPTHDTHSSPIKVEDFEKYTRDALASNLLNSQYTTFAPGPAKPCEFGKLEENVTKNRYQDQIPYDDTRVILNDDPNSDYINANYIRGYSKSKAYIATQGPKPKTVKDFWRMIWQEKVSVICMLANVVEGGRKKCEQYWPEIGTRVKNGDILISTTNHQVFADYTFRTLSVRYGKETREVVHLHYTGWPDHGVPMYTQSLVLYLKKLLATSNGAGPIVVHCSAGVGRTGTIILCAICLRRAVAERVIDVPAVLVRMREDRANMVNNAQQYLLAHLAIVESMTVQQTQIPCDDFLPVKIKELKKQLPSDIKRLKDTVWQDRVLHSLAAESMQNRQNVTDGPSETVSADFENRINAVSVDGARLKRQYLASGFPSTSTLSDFWALIAEKRIELVVILQRPDPKDRKCCDIVPSKTITDPLPGLQVEIKKEPEKQEYFTTNKLMLTEMLKGESRTQPVTVLSYTGCGQDKKRKQPTAAGLVALWMASEKIPRKEAPTLVLCQNGVTLCGLYLALNFLLERMTVEGECDVISAVRAVRRSKTDFVQSSGQFEQLYEAAVNYHELFKTYANFS